MQRVYLDQKDFSRIAQGLSGKPDCLPDARVYEFLHKLVEEGLIRVYFSWAHVVEALRYHKDQVELLKPYCDVIDKLTDGHCIIFPTKLEERELELALADTFGFSSELDKSEYAYGRYAEAVGIQFDDLDPKEVLRDVLHECLDELPLSREEKESVLDKIKNERNMELPVQFLPETTLREMAVRFPSAPGFFTGENVVKMLLGTPDDQGKKLWEFIQGAFTFKNLVTIYSKQNPELRKVGSFFDQDSMHLGSLIRILQSAQGLLGRNFIREKEIEENLAQRFVDHLEPEITEYAEKHGFSVQEAKTTLLDSKLEPMPSIHVLISAVREYVRRHKGVPGRARDPLSSDLMDLQHLRNLPYVDLFVTDRFAADVARDAARTMGTKVLRSLNELRQELNIKTSA